MLRCFIFLLSMLLVSCSQSPTEPGNSPSTSPLATYIEKNFIKRTDTINLSNWDIPACTKKLRRFDSTFIKQYLSEETSLNRLSDHHDSSFFFDYHQLRPDYYILSVISLSDEMARLKYLVADIKASTLLISELSFLDGDIGCCGSVNVVLEWKNDSILQAEKIEKNATIEPSYRIDACDTTLSRFLLHKDGSYQENLLSHSRGTDTIPADR